MRFQGLAEFDALVELLGWLMRSAVRLASLPRIDKRLCWSLLKRDLHMVSIFKNLDGPPPAYMQARNSAAHPDFSGWFSGRQWQERLQAALDAQGN